MDENAPLIDSHQRSTRTESTRSRRGTFSEIKDLRRRSTRRQSVAVLVNPYGDSAGNNVEPTEEEEEIEEQEKEIPAPGDWRGLIITAISCVAWATASGGNVSLVNWILKVEKFSYPITVTLQGQLASWLVAIVAMQLRKHANLDADRPRYRAGWGEYFKTFIPLGFLTAASFALCGMAYVYLSVAFVQMLKASSPITTMMVMFAMGMERPRIDIIMSIAVIALGCLLSAMGEVHFSGYGVVIYLLSDVFDALRMVWTESMLRTRLNVWEGLILIAPPSSFFLFVFACIKEIPEAWSKGDFSIHFWHVPHIFIMAAFATSLVNLLTMDVIKRTNTLTFKVLGQAKNIAVVITGVLLFGDTVRPMQALAYTVSTIGFFLYHRAKEIQRREEEDEALISDMEEAIAEGDQDKAHAIQDEVVRHLSMRMSIHHQRAQTNRKSYGAHSALVNQPPAEP